MKLVTLKNQHVPTRTFQHVSFAMYIQSHTKNYYEESYIVDILCYKEYDHILFCLVVRIVFFTIAG